MQKCHQRIIREKLAREEKHGLFGEWWSTIDTTPKNAEIKTIDRKLAEEIILKYEWLGTLPANYMLYVGLFYDNNCAGV